MTRTFDSVEDFSNRLGEVMAEEEADQPRLTWWLSFADGTLPKGQQFLGVVLVDDCPGLASARWQMTMHCVASPGGEIRGFGFDPNVGPPDQVAALARLPRLTVLSLAELVAAGIDLMNP